MATTDIVQDPREPARKKPRVAHDELPEGQLPKGRLPEDRPAGGKRKWLWIVLVLVIAGIGFAVYRARSSAAQQAAAKPQTPPTVPIVAVAVQRRDVPVYLTGLGTVTAFNTVTVRSRVDGQLIAVNFVEGQFVKAGELLAQIDPRTFQVAVAQAEGQRAKDEAALKNAELDLERYKLLWQEGVISRQQYDAQVASVGQIQGTIRSDLATIANPKLLLSFARITAPIAGRVGLRLVDKGNIIHANDPNGLVVITQVQPIAVLFTLPEDVLGRVASQMAHGSSLQAEAYTRDNLTRVATGRLTTMDNQIDPTTGTIRLKAVFDNRDLTLWPNQFVNVRLLLTVRRNALWIPSAAIQRGSQGNFVYIAKDGKAELRTVQPDFVEGNGTVIASGLNEGEQVVVDGQDKLQNGSKVDARAGGGKRNSGASAQDNASQGGNGRVASSGSGQGSAGQTSSGDSSPAQPGLGGSAPPNPGQPGVGQSSAGHLGSGETGSEQYGSGHPTYDHAGRSASGQTPDGQPSAGQTSDSQASAPAAPGGQSGARRQGARRRPAQAPQPSPSQSNPQ